MAKGLNYIVFAKHESNLRQKATIQELKSLSALQEKLAFAVNMGYNKNLEELINEMRRIYRVMVFTRNTSKTSTDLLAPFNPILNNNKKKDNKDDQGKNTGKAPPVS